MARPADQKANSTRLHAALTICVLSLLSIFPPLATDMYLSAMGHLSRTLHASQGATELSLSLFFLGLCLGQLFMGPLSDAFGRKLPLILGTAIFIATSIGLLLVENITLFNTLRFIQAIGACAGMVVGRAVVMDLYDGRKAAQVLTILIMLMTLGPILSPFMGSLLLTSFGWQSIFVTLIIIGITALALIILIIPETLPKTSRQTNAIRGAFHHFGKLARRPAFVLPTLLAALVQAPMFAFITASSGVFQHGYGLSSLSYGLLFGFIASALVVFGQINNWLLNKHSPSRIISFSFPAFVTAAAILLALSRTDTLWLLVSALWLTLGMVSLLTANTMSIAMEGSPEATGLGSACIGTVQFGTAFAISSLVAFAGTETAAPMASAIFACALTGYALWTCLRPKAFKKNSTLSNDSVDI